VCASHSSMTWYLLTYLFIIGFWISLGINSDTIMIWYFLTFRFITKFMVRLLRSHSLTSFAHGSNGICLWIDLLHQLPLT